jgi:hypothetical protein
MVYSIKICIQGGEGWLEKSTIRLTQPSLARTGTELGNKRYCKLRPHIQYLILIIESNFLLKKL